MSLSGDQGKCCSLEDASPSPLYTEGPPGAHSLWLGSVWPQPDTQHCDPRGKCCSLAGKHTAPTVSVEKHIVLVLAQARLLSCRA